MKFKKQRRRALARPSNIATSEALELRRLLSDYPVTAIPGFVTGPVLADTVRDVDYLADQTSPMIVAVNTDVGATVAATAIAAPAGGLAESIDGKSLIVSEPTLRQAQELSLPALKVIATLPLGTSVYAVAISSHGEIYGASDTGLYEFTAGGTPVGRISAVSASYHNARLEIFGNGDILYATAPNLTNDNYGVEEYNVESASAYESEFIGTTVTDSEDFAVSSDGEYLYSTDVSTPGELTVTPLWTSSIPSVFQSTSPDYFALAEGPDGDVYVAGSGAFAPVEIFSETSGNLSQSFEFSFTNATDAADSGVASHGMVVGLNGSVLIVSPDGTEVTLATFGVFLLSITTVPTTVTGTVFVDSNDNGSTAPPSTGVAGATVYVGTLSAAALQGTDLSTTTDADGSYTLSGLGVSSENIRVNPPAGYVSTDAGFGSTQVTAPATGVNFPVFQSMTVNGFIYNDTNGNGRRDQNETVAGGVQVYEDLNHNGVFNTGEPTTTTDATGIYTLTGVVPAGDYPGSNLLIGFVAPSGKVSESQNVAEAPESGGVLNLTTGLSPSSDISGAVLLNPANGSPFGLGGQTVFADLNGNGRLDAGEPSAVTDGNGQWSINGLPAGAVAIDVVAASGYAVSGSSSETVTLGTLDHETAASFVVTANFGTATGSISGIAFVDANGNGIDDPGEVPAVNRTLYLDTNDNGVLDPGEPTAVSDSTGAYFFNGLGKGSYVLRQAAVAYAPDTSGPQTVNLTTVSGTTLAYPGLNLGTRPASQASISGVVFNDVNGDGTQEPGDDNLSYATLFLDLNGNGIYDYGEPVATNGPTGFIFSNVAPGSYGLYTNLPTGYESTSPRFATGTVGQTVTVIAGQTAYASFGVTQTVVVANAGGPYTVTPGSTLSLDGSASTVSAYDRIVQYAWDLNYNGSSFVTEYTSTTPLLTITSTSGLISYNYTLALQVTDLSGATSIATTQLGVTAPRTIVGTVFNYMFGQTVYLDANDNGVLDPGELSQVLPAIANYNYLEFKFQNVPNGTYVVRQSGNASQISPVYQAGISVVIDGVHTPEAADFTDGGAGGAFDVVTGQVSGGAPGETLYLDANDNGVFDTGELTTTLTASGAFTFDNVDPASYLLRQVLPAGYTQTYPAYDSPIPVTTSGLEVTFSGNDFTDISATATGAVSGTVTGAPAGVTVYLDANTNGVFDSGELSTTTAAGGAYGFASVPAGWYVVRQVTPGGYTQTSPISNGGIAITVAAGSSLTGKNFSDAAIPAGGNVSGTVTGGQAGETIYLDANNNSVLDSTEPSATLLASGAYSFTGVTAGAYVVRQVLPSGYTQTTPTGGYGIHVTVTSGGTLTGENFTDKPPVVVTTGSVAGVVTGGVAGELVYLDANNNGVFDSGELPATTSATGAFNFTSVPVGSYVLRQLLPSGYTQTTPAGNAGLAIAVSAGAALVNENFTDAAPAAAAGSVSGTVTTGLAGETIYLDANNNSLLDATELSTTTSAVGTFSFSNVPVGAYVVRQVLPSGYTQTVPASNYGIHVSVSSGGSLTGENFTDKAPVVVTTGSVSGVVTGGQTGETIFLDANGNGVLDAGELSTTTSSTGAFAFASVPAGSYVLRQVLPTGYLQTSPAGNAGIAVTVIAGGALTGETFTDTAPATTGGSVAGVVTGSSVGEVVYLDANNNSKLDVGELSTTTSATGTYSFANVPAGAYIVRQVLPTGYTQTTPAGGLGIHLAVTTTSKLIGENFADQAPGMVHTKLTGTTIGTAGSYDNSGNTIAKATDGSVSTYFDGPTASGNWVGLDLGSARSISQIAYAPRSGYASRMTGGEIQISTTADFSSSVTTIYTISSTPASSLTTITLGSPVTARYIRYLGPAGSYGDISEFQVFS